MSSAIPTHGGVVDHGAPVVAPAPASVPTGWVRRVALAGTIAPPAFFIVMTVLGQVTPGYDWVSRYGSELSLGRLGGIMIANFIALGVVQLAMAVALGHTIGDRFSGWVATGAIGIMGAAFVVAGVCVTDPARLVQGAHTWHGIVHAFMAVVIFFITTPIAGLAMARRARRTRFARSSAGVAVATPALLIASFMSGNLVGLAERVVIAVLLVWLSMLARQLHRGAFSRR
jgi:hypothetical membrane protein